jgi:hypothetical protein
MKPEDSTLCAVIASVRTGFRNGGIESHLGSISSRITFAELSELSHGSKGAGCQRACRIVRIADPMLEFHSLKHMSIKMTDCH